MLIVIGLFVAALALLLTNHRQGSIQNILAMAVAVCAVLIALSHAA